MLIPKIDGAKAPAAVAPPTGKQAAKASAEAVLVGTRSFVEPTASVPAAAEPAVDELKAAVAKANQAMAAMSASLSFEVDADTKTTVVKIVDTTDNSVLRQIPSQEMLQIARALDRLQGLLVRDKA